VVASVSRISGCGRASRSGFSDEDAKTISDYLKANYGVN
jgi:hypothetical protein